MSNVHAQGVHSNTLLTKGKCIDPAHCKGLFWPLEWVHGKITTPGLYMKDSISSMQKKISFLTK